ncbi:IclR family transcriptional regulator [Arthrobacter sp. 24S4-2]|uniref:IclR family transcriptional regulator n=1 Tax=Arthrobacter sp. 24S4-2 TaxID=2575374 RepID=UPI0010C7A431|nr:IclR family transcriptional regulator [Arthrobacter sp. 24S4-2]QCO98421.1 IclR family transcriptional regulator [Arthrobacter sp. 24S4-2]
MPVTTAAVGGFAVRDQRLDSKVPAAENTLRILKLLASRRGPMPAASIARALGVPRSSVYDLLGVMEANGFVLHLPEEQRYGLGIRAFEVSSAYSLQEPLSRLGRPMLASLVDVIGESAHLAVLHGRDVLYIVEERAKNRPSLVTDVGVRLPSHLTASGSAILAAVPKSQVRALYPNPAAFTARHEVEGAIMKYSVLSSHLDQVRQRGYATEHGEVTPGFGSIAAAVTDHVGWPTAAVAVTFLEDKLPPEQWPVLAARVQKIADELSIRIHGRPGSG